MGAADDTDAGNHGSEATERTVEMDPQRSVDWHTCRTEATKTYPATTNNSQNDVEPPSNHPATANTSP